MKKYILLLLLLSTHCSPEQNSTAETCEEIMVELLRYCVWDSEFDSSLTYQCPPDSDLTYFHDEDGVAFCSDSLEILDDDLAKKIREELANPKPSACESEHRLVQSCSADNTICYQLNTGDWCENDSRPLACQDGEQSVADPMLCENNLCYELRNGSWCTDDTCEGPECADRCEAVECNLPTPSCEGTISVTYDGRSNCDPLSGDCISPEPTRKDCAQEEEMICIEGECVSTKPVAPLEGDLIINEISAESGEWFEIRNLANKTLNLNDLILGNGGGGSHTIENAPPLLPKEYYVLGKPNAPFIDYQYENFSFDKTLIIEDDSGVVLDGLSLVGQGWPNVFDDHCFSEGRYCSVEFGREFDPISDVEDPKKWCYSSSPREDADTFGTPGKENGACTPTTSAQYTIYQIQDENAQPHPASNSLVAIKNVVITGIRSNSFGSYGKRVFAQESGGGANSGIVFVVADLDVSSLSVGDHVDLDALFVSDDYPHLKLLSFTKLNGSSSLVPEILDPNIFVDKVRAKKWTGVLVQFNEVGVLSVNAPFGQFTLVPGNGPFRAESHLFDFQLPETCDLFENIVGVIDRQPYFNFFILPRSESDLTLSNKTVIDERNEPTVTIDILDQQNGYAPDAICINSSQSIFFTNQDAIDHDAQSRDAFQNAANNLSLNNLFLSGLLSPGQSEMVKLNDNNTFHYRSSLYPSMEGVVIVVR